MPNLSLGLCLCQSLAPLVKPGDDDEQHSDWQSGLDINFFCSPATVASGFPKATRHSASSLAAILWKITFYLNEYELNYGLLQLP